MSALLSAFGHPKFKIRYLVYGCSRNNSSILCQQHAVQHQIPHFVQDAEPSSAGIVAEPCIPFELHSIVGAIIRVFRDVRRFTVIWSVWVLHSASSTVRGFQSALLVRWMCWLLSSMCCVRMDEDSKKILVPQSARRVAVEDQCIQWKLEG